MSYCMHVLVRCTWVCMCYQHTLGDEKCRPGKTTSRLSRLKCFWWHMCVYTCSSSLLCPVLVLSQQVVLEGTKWRGLWVDGKSIDRLARDIRRSNFVCAVFNSCTWLVSWNTILSRLNLHLIVFSYPRINYCILHKCAPSPKGWGVGIIAMGKSLFTLSNLLSRFFWQVHLWDSPPTPPLAPPPPLSPQKPVHACMYVCVCVCVFKCEW